MTDNAISREEVRQSALERAKRTLIPALGIDLAVAVALVLDEWVGGADLTSGADWRTLGLFSSPSR